MIKNPFINDSRLSKMAHSGAKYVVVSPECDYELDFMGFKDKAMAFQEAASISDCSLWCYIIDVTTSSYPVVAYVPEK